MFHCSSGFGCCPGAAGTAVFGEFVNDRESTRIERFQIARLASDEEVKAAIAERDAEKEYFMVVSVPIRISECDHAANGPLIPDEIKESVLGAVHATLKIAQQNGFRHDMEDKVSLSIEEPSVQMRAMTPVKKEGGA